MMCDARWQKAMGWNSLDATGCAVEVLTGFPMSVHTLHRPRPSSTLEDDSRANTDLSAKGCDASAAGLSTEDLQSIGMNVTHILKDGDASALNKAAATKASLHDEMTDDTRHGFTRKLEGLACARHHGKRCAQKSSEAWRKSWRTPKTRPSNYVRGTASKAIAENMGNAEAIHKRMAAVVKHLGGDHSDCPAGHGCKLPPEEAAKSGYKQTMEVNDEDVLTIIEESDRKSLQLGKVPRVAVRPHNQFVRELQRRAHDPFPEKDVQQGWPSLPQLQHPRRTATMLRAQR